MVSTAKASAFSPIWWLQRVGGGAVGFLFSSNIITLLGRAGNWAQADAFPTILNVLTSSDQTTTSVILTGFLICLTISALFVIGKFIWWLIVGALIGMILPILWPALNIPSLDGFLKSMAYEAYFAAIRNV